MSAISPFPYVTDTGTNICNGTLFVVPALCGRVNKQKCNDFYLKIRSIPGVHTCPFGFSSYVTNSPDKTIYSGLRIVGHYDIRRLRKEKEKQYSPSLPLDVVVRCIGETQSKQKKQQQSEKLVDKLEGQAERHKDFIQRTLHEVRKFNAQAKKFAEELNRACDSSDLDKEYVQYRAQNLFAVSSLISTRLNAYDLEENPNIFRSEQKNPVGVYKKFEKTKHCLQILAKEKSINIILNGSSYFEINAYPIFDILPFLLIENGIKYSPSNQPITITFDDSRDKLEVVITTLGPLLMPEEADRIFERRFRGKHAQVVDTSGGGYGMHLAKLIADLHEITIEAWSNAKKFDLGGVPYGEFVVSLRLGR